MGDEQNLHVDGTEMEDAAVSYPLHFFAHISNTPPAFFLLRSC